MLFALKKNSFSHRLHFLKRNLKLVADSAIAMNTDENNFSKPDSLDAGQTQEPDTSYKKLTFFSSIEEAKEAEATELANLSGVENLSNTLKLIKRVYAKEIANNPIDKRIYFH